MTQTELPERFRLVGTAYVVVEYERIARSMEALARSGSKEDLAAANEARRKAWHFGHIWGQQHSIPAANHASALGHASRYVMAHQTDLAQWLASREEPK